MKERKGKKFSKRGSTSLRVEKRKALRNCEKEARRRESRKERKLAESRNKRKLTENLIE